MNKIKVAIVGTGFGVKVHLPGYLLSDIYEVKGIYAHSKNKGEHIAMQYNIKNYESIDEIVLDSEIDLVSIAAIPKDHFDFAKKAILAGKAVILEKPMAMNVEESKILRDLANKYNSKVAIVHEHRFDSSKKYLQYLIKTQCYGKVRSIEIKKHMTYWNSPKSERLYDWFANRDLGGGMVGAHLSHQIDFLHFIGQGSLKFIQGFSFTEVQERFDLTRNDYRKHTSDDSVYALAITATGIPVTIDISASKFIKMDYIKVFTDKGEIKINGQNSMEFHSFTGKDEIINIPLKCRINDYGHDFRINSFVELINAFYNYYYKEGKKEITTFEDGYEIQLELANIKSIERRKI